MKLVLMHIAIAFVAVLTTLEFYAGDPIATVHAVMLTGCLANYVAIASNGWRMPARRCRKMTANHRQMNRRSRVRFLCDVFDVGMIQFSVGDVVIWTSVVIGIVRTLL